MPRQSRPHTVLPLSSSPLWGTWLAGTGKQMLLPLPALRQPGSASCHNTMHGRPATCRSRAATRFICSQSRRLAASASSACGGEEQACRTWPCINLPPCMLLTAALQLPLRFTAPAGALPPSGAIGPHTRAHLRHKLRQGLVPLSQRRQRGRHVCLVWPGRRGALLPGRGCLQQVRYAHCETERAEHGEAP